MSAEHGQNCIICARATRAVATYIRRAYSTFGALCLYVTSQRGYPR